jgi:pimeloyl-ACP methyl ester carboxylesterase
MKQPLYLHRYGQGPVRHLALHGWAGTHSTYAAVAGSLPQGQSLLAMDMPGYGRSLDPDQWSLEGLAQSVASRLEGRVETPCTLVGNCSGAIVALLLYQASPQWFDRVILVEPFAYTPWYFGLFLWPLLGRLFYWSTFENPLGRWITDRAMRDQSAQGEDLASGFLETRGFVALGYLRLLASLRQPGRFASVDAPVTLIYGDRTLQAVKDSVQTWRQVWPQAQVHRLEGAGHLLLQEKPGQAAALLAQSSPARAELEPPALAVAAIGGRQQARGHR